MALSRCFTKSSTSGRCVRMLEYLERVLGVGTARERSPAMGTLGVLECVATGSSMGSWVEKERCEEERRTTP